MAKLKKTTTVVERFAKKAKTKAKREIFTTKNGKRYYLSPSGLKKFLCVGDNDTCESIAQRKGLCRVHLPFKVPQNKSKDLDTNPFDDNGVYTATNGRRYIYAASGRKRYLCNGDDNTCPKNEQRQGLCKTHLEFKVELPKCTHVGEDGVRCKSDAVTNKVCVRHGGEAQKCTHVDENGVQCGKNAKKDRLCQSHGGKAGFCEHDKARNRCVICNPMSCFVNDTRRAIANSMPRRSTYKTLPKAPECLECTGEEYEAHIESLFQEGMSWENYGAGRNNWQIDHIKPFFPKNQPPLSKKEILERFHYTNTQPLWFIDNQTKGNKTN